MTFKTLGIVTLTSLLAFSRSARLPSHTPPPRLWTPINCNDFPSISKEELCTGACNIALDPKHIPLLVTNLRYCYETSKDQSCSGAFRRHVLFNLLESATPVLHKAYFDSKINLKHVVAFTRVKLDVLEFDAYADSIECDLDVTHKWKFSSFNSCVTYLPGSCGLYDRGEDMALCQQLLTRHSCRCNHAVFDKSKMMEVSKYTREILIPIFNLTIPLQADDAAYTIIDMYVLSKRCYGYTDGGPAGVSAACDSLLQWIRKEILPYVNPLEFEKVRDNIKDMPMNDQQNTPETLVNR